MIGFAAARDAIRAKVAAVAGIGAVYGYMRLVTTETDIASDMVTSGRLHYWCVVPSQDNPYSQQRHPSVHRSYTYRYDVHGFYALDGAGLSQQAFTDIVLAVIAAFEQDGCNLDNTVVNAGPAQWKTSDERMFVDALCHHAQLSIEVTEH
jgi:hypothetical protein